MEEFVPRVGVQVVGVEIILPVLLVSASKQIDFALVVDHFVASPGGEGLALRFQLYPLSNYHVLIVGVCVFQRRLLVHIFP